MDSISSSDNLNGGKNKSFWDHADELRMRFIKSILAFCAAGFTFSFFVDRTIEQLSRPVGHLVFTSPADAFVARFSLILIGGLLLSSPYVFYQVGQFISAGLKEKEKKYVKMFLPFSVGLFIAGVCFAYFLVIPFTVKFLLGYASEYLVPMITVKSYFSFVGTTLLVFGCVFELPLILVFLTKIGVATPEFLKHYRSYAVVTIFIVSAVVTPPDIISQMVMAIPLCLLYELGILMSGLIIKSNERKLSEASGTKILGLILGIVFLGFTHYAWSDDVPNAEKLLSRYDALVVAEATAEARVFYGLNDGKYMNCIEKNVLKSCEFSKVACIEDAWVVRFTLGEICKAPRDERLSLNIVVSSKDGSIISRYPPKEYFETASYCEIDKDCMGVKGAKGIAGCQNFIYGPFSQSEDVSPDCRCNQNQCIVEKQP